MLEPLSPKWIRIELAVGKCKLVQLSRTRHQMSTQKSMVRKAYRNIGPSFTIVSKRLSIYTYLQRTTTSWWFQPI